MLLLLPLVTTKKPLSRSVGRSWWRNPRHVYYTTSVQQESWRKNTTYTRKHTLITTETKSHTCRNCQSELSVLVTPSLSTPTHPCCGSLQIFRNNQAPAAPRYCCCCLLVEFHAMLQKGNKLTNNNSSRFSYSCYSSSSALLLLLLTTWNLLQTIIRHSASKSRSSSSSVCEKQTVGAPGRTDVNLKTWTDRKLKLETLRKP